VEAKGRNIPAEPKDLKTQRCDEEAPADELISTSSLRLNTLLASERCEYLPSLSPMFQRPERSGVKRPGRGVVRDPAAQWSRSGGS
jgi:hypothetical protein